MVGVTVHLPLLAPGAGLERHCVPRGEVLLFLVAVVAEFERLGGLWLDDVPHRDRPGQRRPRRDRSRRDKDAVAAPATSGFTRVSGTSTRSAPRPPGRFRPWAVSDTAFCSTTWSAPLVQCAGDSTHGGSGAGLGHQAEPLKLAARQYALTMADAPHRTHRARERRSPTCPHSTASGASPCSPSWACTPAST